MTGPPISTNQKRDHYNMIFIIINRLTKMIHYKLIKTTIDISGLVKIIINLIIRYHGFPESIVSNKNSLFTLNFWSLLRYFLNIKQKLSTAFHLQTNGWTERQNSKMKAYLHIFFN